MENNNNITTISLSSFSMSQQVNELFTALSSLQGEMEAVKKENHGHRHRYADINTVLEMVRPLMRKYGLSIQQHPATDEHGKSRLLTILCHTSGQFTSSSMRLVYDEQDIQSLGGSITYQRRYALVSILGIEQEDDDGNYSKAPKVLPKISPKQVENITKCLQQYDKDEHDKIIKLIYAITKTNKISDMTDNHYNFVMKKFFDRS